MLLPRLTTELYESNKARNLPLLTAQKNRKIRKIRNNRNNPPPKLFEERNKKQRRGGYDVFHGWSQRLGGGHGARTQRKDPTTGVTRHSAEEKRGDF